MTLSQRSFALKTESRRREHQEAFSVCRRGVGFRRDTDADGLSSRMKLSR